MRKFRVINKCGINVNFSNLVTYGIDVNDIDTKLRECEFDENEFLDLLMYLSDLKRLNYGNWKITFTSDDLIKLKGKSGDNYITLYIEKESN